MASSDATRSSIVSPMPMRMPVVKGTPSFPASSIVRRRSAGNFGRASCRMCCHKVRAGALQHKSEARITRAQAFNPIRAQQPWIGMRQQPSFPQYQRTHRLQIMQGAAIAQTPQRLAHLREDRLRPVAQRKQRLGAAEPFALLRD